ncbi:MAG: SIS domain-containing protein [Acidimicrobiales bacterium]
MAHAPMTSHMRLEIAEQPTAIAATLDAMEGVVPDIARVGAGRRHVLLFGRGSSRGAAVYGRYLIEVTAGLPVGLGEPSIGFLFRAAVDLGQTLAIFISQSGKSEELEECALWARSHGAATIALTNTADSSLAAACGLAVVTPTGVERAVPATKSFTAAMVALAFIALALAERRPAWAAHLRDLPAAAERQLFANIRPVVDVLGAQDLILAVGRALTLSTAQETALKIVEAAAIPSYAISAAELQHGPAAVLRPGVGVLLIGPAAGPTLNGLTAIAHTARAASAAVTAVGGHASLAALADGWVTGPDLPEPLAPIVLTVAGQLIAAALAEQRGQNPDVAAGLAKVTHTIQ